MARTFSGPHHFSKRRRIYIRHEPYPHPDKWKRLLDRVIYAVGILGPVLTIPQVLKIWVENDASGVSGVSWFSYLVFAVIWVIYGIAHKQKPIILAYSLWIVLESLIVAGTVMYGSFF